MNKQRTLLDLSSCLNKASHDEPLFVLRAKDPLAPLAIIHWVTMNQERQSPEKLAEALKVAEEMEQWRLSQAADRPAACAPNDRKFYEPKSTR